MEQLERLRARLNNVEAVQPMLDALRAISSSARLQAIHRKQRAAEYRTELSQVLSWLRPHLPRRTWAPSIHSNGAKAQILLVIGSERGLCGAFNQAVAIASEQALAKCAAAGDSVRLVALGTRARRALRARGHEPMEWTRLPATSLPTYPLADGLAGDWLDCWRRREVGAVVVVYNAYRGLAQYEPRAERILPVTMPPDADEEEAEAPWIETDPFALYQRLRQLWLSATLYGILLESSASEHSARFRLLDGASQNAERLTDELRLYLQAARQEAITTELQDLAAGAGLLGQLST